MSGHSDHPAKPPLIPTSIVYLIVLGVVASWLPFALISLSRAKRTPNRPVHLFLDMDIQPKYKAQAFNPAFADHRSERPPIEGTVSRAAGPAIEDDHYYRGYETDGNGTPLDVDGKPQVAGTTPPKPNKYFADFPKQVVEPFDVTDKRTKEEAAKLNLEHRLLLLQRGRDRFNIYCAVCHGDTGFGDGLIKQRADHLNDVFKASHMTAKLEEYPAATFGIPRNLHEEGVRTMAIGQVFNTISLGARNMRGYAAQIPVEDRWAIVAYVKALQLAETFPEAQLPDDLKAQLPALK